MQKISDIIPYLEKGMTTKEVAKKFKKSIPTINRYIKTLRDNGFSVKVKQGRPKLEL